MKNAYTFLVIPLLATLLDILFASLLVSVVHPTRGKASAQRLQPAINHLVHRPSEAETWVALGELKKEHEEYSDVERVSKEVCDDDKAAVDEDEDDERDPMLRRMEIPAEPYYFDAYVRQDISSFYREPLGSRVEVTPKMNGQAGKFTNMSPHRMELHWVSDRGDEHFIGNVGPFDSGGTATFPGHEFIFKRHDTKETVCRFFVEAGKMHNYYDPYEADDAVVDLAAARGRRLAKLKPSLDELSDYQLERYKAHRFNLEFATLYKNFTGGSEWLAMYPKPPPRHKMWRADYIGMQHKVQTKETQFMEVPPNLNDEKNFVTKRGEKEPLPFAAYRAAGIMNVTIKAVSVAPRAFQIDGFLSEIEVDHVLDLVMRRNLQRSTTGSLKDGKKAAMSSTRTSKNTWIARNSSPILDAIYRRASDVLRIDEKWLRTRGPNEESYFGVDDDEDDDWMGRQAINEEMQIVHYDKGQEYTAHHDFGYDDTPPYASRSINLCIYLNDTPRGGETSFPRWRNAETEEGMNMKPEKGKAMIFYMVNPDGNLDDLTQHAALPVLEGEKWFANLWIWDPHRT